MRAVRAPHELVVASPALRFALPDGWHRYERPADPSAAWVREAAATQHYTARDYVEQLAASTLASAVGPASGGRYQVVDVQTSGFAALPTAEGRTDTEVIHLVSHGKALMITVSAVGAGDVEAVTAEILTILRTS